MPFGSWMSINHPDDMLTMYTDKHGSGVRYTEDSNRLWEQRSTEYAAVVKQNPAAYLDQPEVAAYLAKLDSICAAAQARVKNKIKAIPEQNQRRPSRPGRASCRRRFPSCARSRCPRPSAGPTRDARSRSWSSSTNIRTMCSDRNRWPARSSRSPASTSAFRRLMFNWTLGCDANDPHRLADFWPRRLAVPESWVTTIPIAHPYAGPV